MVHNEWTVVTRDCSKIVVGIPTVGRSDTIVTTVRHALLQTLRPDRVIVCGTNGTDVAGLHGLDGVEVITAERGLPRQRNAILRLVADCDVILFLDDDFIMSPRYVETTLAAFAARPALVATTGDLLADGSRNAGYSVEEAEAIIRADGDPSRDGWEIAPHAYGCNMALRLATVRDHDLRFDERLPLYAWSEDIDFTHRIGRHGEIAKLAGARGVHLGTKSGRTSGYRLGYSQVANPIYLYGKGSYDFRRAAGSVGRNMAMNLARSAWPEPFVDRLGRLRGNAMALLDIVRGRLAPERILDL